MNTGELTSKMLILLLIIVVGYIVRKCKLLDEGLIAGLSKLTVNVFLFALILSSVMNVETGLSTKELLILLAVCVGIHFLLLLFAFLVPRILGAKRQDYGTYSFMEAFGNCSFMGLPIITALFGEDKLIYGVIFNIPFYIFTFTVGIKMISGKAENSKVNIKSLLNAPLISVLLALIIATTKLQFPEPIVDFTRMIGNVTVPMAMMIIGASLGGLKLKAVFSDVRVYLFAIIRLIVTPVLVFFLLRVFISNQMVVVICTVLCATPAASNATMMAYTYNGNRELASRGVFVTTVLSALTIPLVLYLLPI